MSAPRLTAFLSARGRTAMNELLGAPRGQRDPAVVRWGQVREAKLASDKGREDDALPMPRRLEGIARHGAISTLPGSGSDPSYWARQVRRAPIAQVRPAHKRADTWLSRVARYWSNAYPCRELPVAYWKPHRAPRGQGQMVSPRPRSATFSTSAHTTARPIMRPARRRFSQRIPRGGTRRRFQRIKEKPATFVPMSLFALPFRPILPGGPLGMNPSQVRQSTKRSINLMNMTKHAAMTGRTGPTALHATS